MHGAGAAICSQLLLFADCSVSARMNEQSERKRTRGTHTGSTPQQVGKRSMSPTSGATLKSKFSAAPSANAGVPLMLLSEKDNFFFLFGVPLACFLLVWRGQTLAGRERVWSHAYTRTRDRLPESGSPRKYAIVCVCVN